MKSTFAASCLDRSVQLVSVLHRGCLRPRLSIQGTLPAPPPMEAQLLVPPPVRCTLPLYRSPSPIGHHQLHPSSRGRSASDSSRSRPLRGLLRATGVARTAGRQRRRVPLPSCAGFLSGFLSAPRVLREFLRAFRAGKRPEEKYCPIEKHNEPSALPGIITSLTGYCCLLWSELQAGWQLASASSLQGEGAGRKEISWL